MDFALKNSLLLCEPQHMIIELVEGGKISNMEERTQNCKSATIPPSLQSQLLPPPNARLILGSHSSGKNTHNRLTRSRRRGRGRHKLTFRGLTFF